MQIVLDPYLGPFYTALAVLQFYRLLISVEYSSEPFKYVFTRLLYF